MVSSDDIFKTFQLLTIIFWVIPNSQVQCHKLPSDSSSELLPSYSLSSSQFTIFDNSKDDRTSGISMYFKEDISPVETSVNLFSSFTQTQAKSFLWQNQLEVFLSPSSSSYFLSSSSILLPSNNLQTNSPSISLASSLVEACLSISMFNSLTANIEDPNNSHSIKISQTEFISEGDSSISDNLSPYFQPLDNFFSISNSLLMNSTSQILKSILALENLNESLALENFPAVKMKPSMREQNINQSKFDSQINTSFTGVTLNINDRLLDINTSYVHSFNHTQLNSYHPVDEMMSESQIFSSSFIGKSSQLYISPTFHTTSKLLSKMQTQSDSDLNAKRYFIQQNINSLSTLKDLITKRPVSTETENLHGTLTIYSTQQMLWANPKTESMLPYQYDRTKLFALHPSQSQISRTEEIESLFTINKNQIFLYSDHFLASFQSAISQSYLSPFKHFTKNEREFSDLKFSLLGNTFTSVNDPVSSTFRRPITNSHYPLESNSLHQLKFIKPTISQLVSTYFDESLIHFDSRELSNAAAISKIPQQQTKWSNNFFNFQKSFYNNLYQSIMPMSHFNDNQSLLPSLKSETWDIFNEFWKSELEPLMMKSSEANPVGSNSDNLDVPSLRHRTTDIVNSTQSMLQYFSENLYTESVTIDEFDSKESLHLSNTEILEPSETVSLVNVEDFLFLTLQNIFPSFVSSGATNTDTSFTSSSEELFHLLNSGFSFHAQPPHNTKLLQPSTHTYIPITDLSEQSLTSSQIQIPSSLQGPVNFDFMNKFSPNTIFYSDSKQIFQTSSENFQSSLTMAKSNVFSGGNGRYVYDSLQSKLEIITAPKGSSDKTQGYSNFVISSHIPELIDSYSSSSTLEIPENTFFSTSLLPLTSLKNLISTSLIPEVIYSSPFLPNSIQFDNPKFSLYSPEIIQIFSMIYQFTQKLPLITTPVFGNTIESNFKYSPTTFTSQSSDFISSTEKGNASILTSSNSSNSENPVYDSSMINVAVTNFTIHNTLVSTLHSDIDYQLESIYSSSKHIYLYSSQTPLFVLSSFISEDKESNYLFPEFSYLYSSQTSMLVSSGFISKNNSSSKFFSNISNSSLFTSGNLTLSSKQMATLLISNYTLTSINTNTSIRQESLNNNSATKRISYLLTATENSSVQKTEFYVSTSSVLEMFSRNMQLNNSLYFQHFWIVTIIKVRSDININSSEFKHDMEERLARSYVEAYKRGEYIMNGTYRPLRKKRFAVVKDIALQIMKIMHSNHRATNNVSLVYYMEKNGRPVPAKDAIKHMNLIQLQELAIYLNHVVVLRAEVYLKTPDGKYSENWIIGVVLGSVAVILLFMWCVLFIFFKCFRRPPLKVQEVKPINSCHASSLPEIKCNPELVQEDLISKKESQRPLQERDSLKNQNDVEKHYVKIPLEEMSKPKNIKKSSNNKFRKIVSEEQEVPVKNKKQKAKLAQSIGYVSSSTKDYDEKPLKSGNFDQNMKKSTNNEDISSSCYVNLPPIPSQVSLVATKQKFDKTCERRQNLQQQELQMQQDLSPNELYINLNAECEDFGCAECGRSNYTRKNNRKVTKQRKCNLKHAFDVNSFEESSLKELYDDDKLWRRQPDTLQQTCVKMHNLLDDAFQLISMNLPQQNLKNISSIDQSNYPRRNINEKQRYQHHKKSIAEQVLTNRKPFLSQSFHESNHEMHHVPKYSQYQQCECTPQFSYSRHNNISPSWNKAGDELSKISSDGAWIPFMAPNKDCFNHKHFPKPLMHSTQHFPENHKENNLIPDINNFCCNAQNSSYYFPHSSNSSSYSPVRHQLCPHRQIATSLDISTNQLRTIGSKIPNLSSKSSNKIGTVQQFSRFSPQTSRSNQSFLQQKISQKATDDEIDAIYKNIKPNASQPLIQSIREELMTASAYDNEINSFNILD